MPFYVKYKGKRIIEMHPLILVGIIGLIVYKCATGCGQWTDGSTDSKLDCVDGCTPDGVGNNERTTVIQGPPGEPGRDGAPGKNGRDGESGKDGTDGNPGAAGSQGPKGETGAAGATGPAGTDGYSIVSQMSTILEGDAVCPAGGVRFQVARDLNRNEMWDLTDDHQQLASICNGTAGQDGADGEDGHDGENGSDGAPGQDAPLTPLTPVAIIDPCGDKPGAYDEVFIRFQNGQLMASFSENTNGKNTRFSLITVGTYVTTDGTNCIFSVDSNGNLYNEHY